MKFFKIKTTLALLFMLACIATQAQSTTETLTNKSITDLNKAGLGSALIISKIQNSTCNFDVSTNQLIALKKAGISENIIQAMVNKSNGLINSSQTSGTPNSSATNTTSNSNVPNIESINVVYLFNDNKPAMLERNAAKMHSHTKALGYGGAVTEFEVDGTKSPVRLAKGNNVFVVNTGGAPGDAFVLYKVEIKGGKRKAQAASFSSFGGMKGAKGVLPLDVKMLKTNIFQITPTAPLESGEYFFANKSAGSSALSSTTSDVYAFGVD